MTTKYHLNSAQELNIDIIESIKTAFQSKPITIIVEEDNDSINLSTEMKLTLEERLQEDESTYITAEESMKLLLKKYGV
ncbi:hypothetical protein [Mongoliitalea daihaiensis]|jgi:hypothetical protein|uniref:hypothetical protein n=1 Tax=Mongoliitalea daihaiensis TaxID=2782006 RepID=UPI001F3161A9|nr:hypothetical protein [Mongoliitalea daihaiensis]UJP65426.1 hypothetical protein IPZ59_02030 [Mongoliitalea daihaiensis]